jgi:hypothetical protein
VRAGWLREPEARGPRLLAIQCTALRHMRACSGQAGSRLRCRGAVRRHALRKACSRHYRERGSESARAAGRAFVPQCPRQRRGPSHSPSQPMMRNRSVDESSTTHVSASAIKPDGLPPAATRERTRARLPGTTLAPRTGCRCAYALRRLVARGAGFGSPAFTGEVAVLEHEVAHRTRDAERDERRVILRVP